MLSNHGASWICVKSHRNASRDTTTVRWRFKGACLQADKEAATSRTAQIIFLIILRFFLLQRYAREGKKTKKEAAYSAPAQKKKRPIQPLHSCLFHSHARFVCIAHYRCHSDFPQSRSF